MSDRKTAEATNDLVGNELADTVKNYRDFKKCTN